MMFLLAFNEFRTLRLDLEEMQETISTGRPCVQVVRCTLARLPLPHPFKAKNQPG
jgi:hypothetical protein